MITKLNTNDVILGRGGYNYKHPGNKAFKELAKEFAPNYAKSSKSVKFQISKQMVEIVLGANPPGRFLRRKKCGNGYEQEVEFAVAREKACQSLRDAAMELTYNPTPSVIGTNVPTGALDEMDKKFSNFESKRSLLIPSTSQQYEITGQGDHEKRKQQDENTAFLNPIQEKAWEKDDFNPPHDCVAHRNEIYNDQLFPNMKSPHPPPNVMSSEENNSSYPYYTEPILLSASSYNAGFENSISSYRPQHHSRALYNQVDDCSSRSSNITTMCGSYHTESVPPARKRIKRTCTRSTQEYIPPSLLLPPRHPQPAFESSVTMNQHAPNLFDSSFGESIYFQRRLASLGSHTGATTSCDSSIKRMSSFSPPSTNFLMNHSTYHHNNVSATTSNPWQNDDHSVVTSYQKEAVSVPTPRSDCFAPSSSSLWSRAGAVPPEDFMKNPTMRSQIPTASSSFTTEDPPNKKSIFIKRYSTLRTSSFKSPSCEDTSMDDLDLRQCKSTSKSIDSIDSFHEPLQKKMKFW
jgi:hypothetical protein